MKYLRTFSIMVSCFVGAASVQAMNMTTAGEPSEDRRSISSPSTSGSQKTDEERVQYSEKFLGKLILTLGTDPKACEDVRITGLFGSADMRVYRGVYAQLKTEEYSRLYSDSTRDVVKKETETKVGKYFLSNRGELPNLRYYLEEKAEEGDFLKDKDRFCLVHDYIHMLLEGIGIDEERRGEAKKEAYGYITKVLNRDVQEEALDEPAELEQFCRIAWIKIYFFKYFPRDERVPRELNKVRREKEEATKRFQEHSGGEYFELTFPVRKTFFEQMEEAVEASVVKSKPRTLGQAVECLLDNMNRLSYTTIDEDKYAPIKGLYNELKRLRNGPRERDLIGEEKEKIGSYYLQRPYEMAHVMSDFRVATHQNTHWGRYTISVAYNYAKVLLRGVGIPEGEIDQARARAYSLIKKGLSIEPDHSLLKKLLEEYFSE